MSAHRRQMCGCWLCCVCGALCTGRRLRGNLNSSHIHIYLEGRIHGSRLGPVRPDKRLSLQGCTVCKSTGQSCFGRIRLGMAYTCLMTQTALPCSTCWIGCQAYSRRCRAHIPCSQMHSRLRHSSCIFRYCFSSSMCNQEFLPFQRTFRRHTCWHATSLLLSCLHNITLPLLPSTF